MSVYKVSFQRHHSDQTHISAGRVLPRRRLKQGTAGRARCTFRVRRSRAEQDLDLGAEGDEITYRVKSPGVIQVSTGDDIPGTRLAQGRGRLICRRDPLRADLSEDLRFAGAHGLPLGVSGHPSVRVGRHPKEEWRRTAETTSSELTRLREALAGIPTTSGVTSSHATGCDWTRSYRSGDVPADAATTSGPRSSRHGSSTSPSTSGSCSLDRGRRIRSGEARPSASWPAARPSRQTSTDPRRRPVGEPPDSAPRRPDRSRRPAAPERPTGTAASGRALLGPPPPPLEPPPCASVARDHPKPGSPGAAGRAGQRRTADRQRRHPHQSPSSERMGNLNPRSPIDRRTTSVCSIRKCVLPPRLPQTGNATADRPSTPISCHRAGPPGAMLYAMPIPRKLPVSAPGPTKVAGLSSQVRRHVTQVRPK